MLSIGIEQRFIVSNLISDRIQNLISGLIPDKENVGYPVHPYSSLNIEYSLVKSLLNVF